MRLGAAAAKHRQVVGSLYGNPDRGRTKEAQREAQREAATRSIGRAQQGFKQRRHQGGKMKKGRPDGGDRTPEHLADAGTGRGCLPAF